MSFTSCMKKVAGSISPENKLEIMQLARQNRSAGMSAKDASTKAVGQKLTAVARQIKDAEAEAERLQAEVDSAKRSAERVPLHGGQLQTDTPEFNAWFGQSKVVDKDGRPLVVYHGTASDFSVFDKSKRGSVSDTSDSMLAFYFTSSQRRANQAAADARESYDEPSGAVVMPVYLSLQNPMISRAAQGTPNQTAGLLKRALASGHDGVIFDRGEMGGRDYAVFDPEQVKSAIGNDGAFDPNIADITKSPERKVWYSQLQRAIEQTPERLSTMAASQWSQWLKANAGKLGVKGEELEWSGIDDYLKLRGKDKISSAELAQWVGENGVQVTETRLGEPEQRWYWRERTDKSGDTLSRHGPFDTREDALRMATGKYEVGPDDEWRLIDPEQAVIQAAHKGDTVNTKYGQYTLPGGTNYREVLLTLPSQKTKAPEILSAAERARLIDLAGQDRDGVLNTADQTELDVLRSKNKAQTKADDVARKTNPDYHSSHWDQANILAHVRLNDRSDADGKRVLFVEEIQSDWAQQGKKSGFNTEGPTTEERAAAQAELNAADLAQDDIYQEGRGAAANRRTLSDKYVRTLDESERHPVPTRQEEARQALVELEKIRDKEAEKARDFSDRLHAADARLRAAHAAMRDLDRRAAASASHSTPAAPFVAKTSAWVSLALKRVIKMAVDEGYDKVALVNGGQSAERYDLSKQVNYIQWNPGFSSDPEVMRSLVQLETSDGQMIGFEVDTPAGGEGIIAEGDFAGKTLDEVVGKEVAQKINQDDSGDLRGLDLKVGGEGMKAFYDKIVPNVARDVLKKLGGDGLTSVQIESNGSTVKRLGPRRFEVTIDGESKTFSSEESAQQYATKFGADEMTQPGFDITDMMREQAEAGVPLFSRDRSKPDAPGSHVEDFASSVTGVKTFKIVPKRNGSVEILDFEVLPQGSGIGTKAVQEFLSWAADNGYRKVRADSTVGAAPFWSAMGFQATGRKDGKLLTMMRDVKRVPDDRFSRDRSGLDETANSDTSATEGWQSPSASKFDSMVYTMQDKHVDTARVVAAIKDTGAAISDDLDVYLQEELFHGRAAKKTEDFVHLELEPLVEKMKAVGVSVADLDQFLHARHAREANAVIAQRNPEIQDGGSGMLNQDAVAYFAETPSEKLDVLRAMADKVDTILAATKKMMVDYQLESSDTVRGWGEMFEHYVPLMREDDGAHTGGAGTGQGFSIKGKEVKSRTGSTRKVVDIFANIAMQRERTIVRGEKNRVSQALVGLAQANPNKDFWRVDTVPKSPAFNKETGLVEMRPDPMFKQRDNVLVAKVAHPDGIHEHAVIFSEKDERAMRMAAALKNLDAAQLEGFLGASAKVTRYFAAVNTQYNPVFGVVNLVRDVQDAMINLGSTELAGKQATVARQTMSALRGIYGDLRAERRGELGTSQWAHLWEEFKDVGGQTGYRQLFATSNDRAEAIKKALDPTAWMDSKLGKIFTAGGALKVPLAAAQRGAKWVFDWLSDYNEAMENGVRLSAYKTGLDAGMSKERAASLAKNLTVNFNRKGQAAQQAGALYAFFNASAQGTGRVARTLFTMEPGKPKTIRLSALGQKIVAGGMLLGTLQALAMAAAGFGDDDPPEFARNNNLIIPTGGKKYVTIPLPQGFRILPAMGRITTEWAMGGFKNTTKRGLAIASLFADSFNPIGSAGLSMQTLAPTAFDPLIALTENKDFTGRPIAKTSSNKAIPGHELGRDTSTTIGKLISEGINTLTGGTKHTAGVVSPTPDQVDYLIDQVLGGVGRELSKLEQTGLGTVRGEDVPLYKIPLAGRFVGDAASQASESTNFYANAAHLNEIETEIKGLRKEGKFAEAEKFRSKAPDSYLITVANHAELAVQRLRKEKSALLTAGADRDKVKAIEVRITERMASLNRAVEAIKGRAQ